MIIKFPKLTPDELFEVKVLLTIIILGTILTLCFITI